MQILAISGSLRNASSSTSIVRAVALVAPAGVVVSIYDELDKLPHFNPDLDREGNVARLTGQDITENTTEISGPLPPP